MLIAQPPIFTDAVAHYPYSLGLETALTFLTKYQDQVVMATRQGGELLVPRGLAPPPPPGKDFRIVRPMPALSCTKPPRDAEQAECIQQSLALLKADRSHIFMAPTGFGKSYCGTAIALAMGQATLIVVPKDDLMGQWRASILSLAGLDPSEIGIAQADKLDYKGKRIVLGTVQSLTRPGKYDSEFYASFGLLLVDEAHRMAADQFVNVCRLVPAKYRLGLSATPDRTDGKTPVLEAHIGPVLVKGTAVPMKPKVLVQQTLWRVPPGIKVEPKMLAPVHKAMAQSHARNAIIGKFGIACYNKGRNLVLMSDPILNLKQAFFSLVAAGVPGEEIGYYTGEQSSAELKLSAQKRVVLATYGKCSEGTDFPHWDALCCITPRSNVTQANGRVMRKKEGKRQPVILDLVDSHQILTNMHYKRLTQYHQVGADILKVNLP